MKKAIVITILVLFGALTAAPLVFLVCGSLMGSGELTELAEELHFDIYWLSKEIKKRTGKTYTELVQSKRLSQAAYLLRTTAMNVMDISMAVGYDNISYFHRIFQKKYGMTPRKYRLQE